MFHSESLFQLHCAAHVGFILELFSLLPFLNKNANVAVCEATVELSFLFSHSRSHRINPLRIPQFWFEIFHFC